MNIQREINQRRVLEGVPDVAHIALQAALGVQDLELTIEALAMALRGPGEKCFQFMAVVNSYKIGIVAAIAIASGLRALAIEVEKSRQWQERILNPHQGGDHANDPRP